LDYHDVLAELGVGSAHPGGMQSTFTWLNAIDLTKDTKVLDVGCGTGRTACHIQKNFGCQVTGIDIRPKMIQKARIRDVKLGTKVKFLVGSAEKLPFQSEEFDVVITESVNVFVQADRAMKEYFRVLKPQGSYIDVEMMAIGPVSAEWKDSARKVYGARQVPDLTGWKKLYSAAGFRPIKIISSRAVQPEDAWNSDNSFPDEVELSDGSAYSNPKVLQVLQQNSFWLEQNHRSLGYAVFLCFKPSQL